MIMSKLFRTTRVLSAISIFQPWDPDFVEDEPEVIDDTTTKGKLRRLIERDAQGNLHESVISLMNTTAFALIGAGLYGGITTSRFTFIEFIDSNEATQFRDHRDAKRQLSDKMMLSFFRGFVKYGFRVALFCFIFQGCGTLISLIRERESVFDYTLGGACAGAIYKFQMGPKGMFAGGLLGTFFGTLFGICNMALLKLQRLTGMQYKTFQKELMDKRKQMILDAQKKAMDKLEDEAMSELAVAFESSRKTT